MSVLACLLGAWHRPWAGALHFEWPRGGPPLPVLPVFHSACGWWMQTGTDVGDEGNHSVLSLLALEGVLSYSQPSVFSNSGAGEHG